MSENAWKASAVALLIAVAILLGIVMELRGYVGSTAAAWVQGVGSLAAVVAAIGIAIFEGGRAQRIKAEELRELRAVVAEAARTAEALVDLIAVQMQAHPLSFLNGGAFVRDAELVGETLAAFDPTRLQDARGAVNLVTLRHSLKGYPALAVEVSEEAYRTGELSLDTVNLVRVWAWRARTARESLEILEKV